MIISISTFPKFGEGDPIFAYDGRRRTFFFVAWQEQFRSSSTSANRTVPTAAGRTALRNLFAPGVNPRVDLLLEVTKNVVGESSLQNIDIGARAGCPAPCNIQFGAGALFVPQTYRERQAQLRIDHMIGQNDQFSARDLFDDQKDPLGGGITFRCHRAFDFKSECHKEAQSHKGLGKSFVTFVLLCGNINAVQAFQPALEILN